eukprot:403376416
MEPSEKQEQEIDIKQQKLVHWRRNLKKGMKILADDLENWYPSFIINVKYANEGQDDQYTENVQVGYRIYHPAGPRDDNEGPFFGWSSKYDEWISTDSKRILPMLVFEASQGELDFVKYWLNEVKNTINHVQLDMPQRLCVIELKDLYKLTGTPLYCACEAGRNDIAKYLIENNADINITKNYQTPLVIAIMNNHPQIVKLLLQNGGGAKGIQPEKVLIQVKLLKANKDVQDVFTND